MSQNDVRAQYEIRELSSQTWDAFVALCDRHGGGGFGGCYCTYFHSEKHSSPETVARLGRTNENSRDFERGLVDTGHAHAALVFDADTAGGWAQYGSPQELPGIMHRKEYLESTNVLPDYRVTCVFVDRRYRNRGIARAAIEGALDLIAQAGGGTVESYPQDTAGKKVSASFLYSATRSTFEQAGFTYQRPNGKNHCVMSKEIQPI